MKIEMILSCEYGEDIREAVKEAEKRNILYIDHNGIKTIEEWKKYIEVIK